LKLAAVRALTQQFKNSFVSSNCLHIIYVYNHLIYIATTEETITDACRMEALALLFSIKCDHSYHPYYLADNTLASNAESAGSGEVVNNIFILCDTFEQHEATTVHSPTSKPAIMPPTLPVSLFFNSLLSRLTKVRDPNDTMDGFVLIFRKETRYEPLMAMLKGLSALLTEFYMVPQSHVHKIVSGNQPS